MSLKSHNDKMLNKNYCTMLSFYKACTYNNLLAEKVYTSDTQCTLIDIEVQMCTHLFLTLFSNSGEKYINICKHQYHSTKRTIRGWRKLASFLIYIYVSINFSIICCVDNMNNKPSTKKKWRGKKNVHTLPISLFQMSLKLTYNLFTDTTSTQ